jgi:acyl-CoA synthetase (AMP-forming)/AMP-acid ligase II
MGANEMSVQLAEIARHRAQEGEQILAEMAAIGPVTFTRFLRVRARQWLAQQALGFRGRSVSYGALLDLVDRARHALHERGVRPGQSVALLMENSDHYVIWYLAVLGLGAVAVPLNYRLTAGEAAYILSHSGAVLLLTQPEFVPLTGQMERDHDLALARLVLDPADADSQLGAARHGAEPEVTAQTPAALYYTSGTTGQPKGVMHSHASLIADALQSPPSWEYAFNGVRSLAVTPLFHIAAHTIFFPVLFLGGMLIVDAYNTEQTLAKIAEQDVNAFFAVPSILLLMVGADDDLQAWRGASAVSECSAGAWHGPDRIGRHAGHAARCCGRRARRLGRPADGGRGSGNCRRRRPAGGHRADRRTGRTRPEPDARLLPQR